MDEGMSRVASAMSTLAGFLIVFVAASTCFEIVMRYFFNAPTTWVYNFSTILIADMTLLGAAWCLKRGRQIRVDFLIDLLPKRSKLALEAIGDAFVTAFAGLLAYESMGLVVRAYSVHMRVVAVLSIQQWPFRVLFFLGAVLLALVALSETISKVRTLASLDRGDGKTQGVMASPGIAIALFLISLTVALTIMEFVSPVAGIIFVLLVLLFGGVPIFCGLGFVGVFGLLVFDQTLSEVARTSWYSLNHYALVCLPLFMLGGQLLQQGKIADRLFDMASKLVGNLPGGLAIATIGACAVFSTVSGSSVATAATIGLISIPAMLSRGYDKRITYGAAAGGGLLGIMIPPSSAMIVYSGITDEPIAELFMAGVIPGIILAVLFALYVFLFHLGKGKKEIQETVTWGARIRSLKGGVGPMGAVIIVFGGIYSGVFTAIEASAVFVIYAFILAIVMGGVNWKTVRKTVAESTEGVVMIMVIISGAVLLGLAITISGLPKQIALLTTELALPKYAVIGIIVVTWLIMGCFMEGLAIQLITVPIFYPLIKQLGFNGIWFGILLVLAIEMALITPPVGLNVFVIQGIAKAPAKEVILGILPYLFILLIMVPLLYLFPELALWLPGTMRP